MYGRDLYADDLVIIAESLEECVRRLFDMERSNGGERAESKCRKDKDHDLWYGAGSPAEFRRVPIVLSVALEWAATASSAKAVSTGCIRSAVGSSA